jgi:hypothetical protein
MKTFFALPLVIALSIFCSCQKQQTDAERQAEIDRQVQARLDAEHQAQEKEQLAQRQGQLDAREKALADKEAATAKSRERETRSTTTTRSEPPRRTRSDEARPTGSYNTFYTKLESYGDWRETSDYGYVWQPREAQSRSWRPYNDGRWAYTDAGWTWVSEEPFGWATYHYGRWTRLRNVGWVWVPGDEWAPAWVSWRKGDEYVGWAPLPPEARFDRRTGIHNWSDSYYDIGPEQYCFVETRQFGTPRAQRTVVPTERNVTIVNQTTNVTNITYNNTTVVNQGPSYDEIRARSQQPVERLRLEREVNVNINVGEPRPVVRGEAIIIPAPLIARGEAVERPRKVKETIANVVVERGWDGIPDRQAAEKVRVKMQAEATPPPDEPPKTFVKPTEARAETTTAAPAPTVRSTSSVAPATAESPAPVTAASPAATAKSIATPEATATATPTPFHRAIPEATATATPTPFHRATPESTPTPIATATPTARPTFTPRPLPTSTSTPASSPTPTASESKTTSAAAERSAPATEGLAASPKERFGGEHRKRVIPAESAASPSATPSSSAAMSPSAGASPNELSKGERRELRKEERQANKEERQKQRRGEQGEASPSPSATPAEQ